MLRHWNRARRPSTFRRVVELLLEHFWDDRGRGGHDGRRKERGVKMGERDIHVRSVKSQDVLSLFISLQGEICPNYKLLLPHEAEFVSPR